MSPLTLLLYVVALGLWIWCTHREGGIGIGVRFVYAFGLVQQFLVGPPLYFLSGLAESYESYRNREQAVQLVLYCLIGFVAGGYILTPLVLGYRLSMDRAWVPFTHRARLARQWQVGKALVTAGAISLLFVPVMYRINTVRAIWSQVTLLVEAGIVVMCVNGILTHNRRRFRVAFTILVVAGVFRALMSGFFGGTAMTGLFLCSLILMARGITWRAWGYLAVALYLMLIPYGIWMNGRAKLREAIANDAPLNERVQAFEFDEKAPLLFNLLDPEDVKRIQHRIDQSHLLAAALAYTPSQEPYAWGVSMVDNVVVALVPRFLWPDKPLSSGGSEFVSRYTGIKFSKKVSVGVNYVFEFYVNFGHVGAVLGLLLLGLACGILEYKFFELAPGNFAFEWTIVLCMWTIGMTSDMVSQLAMTLPVCVFVGWGLARFFQATGLAPVYFTAGYVGGVPPNPRRQPAPSGINF